MEDSNNLVDERDATEKTKERLHRPSKPGTPELFPFPSTLKKAHRQSTAGNDSSGAEFQGGAPRVTPRAFKTYGMAMLAYQQVLAPTC